MKVRFTKMHGLGNDFIVIDAINQPLNLSAENIRYLADRHFGIGCDQLLLVEPAIHDDADFQYRIFNADGSEVAQCGNGARCFARFVYDRGLTTNKHITVDTLAGRLLLQLDEGGLVTVDMGVPCFDPARIPFIAPQQALRYSIEVAEQTITAGVVALGNPHVVLQVDDIMTAPVAQLGPALEHHQRFPERVNVGFMEILEPAKIRLRVFERGSGETLACGSGACAAVAVGHIQGLLDERVLVELPGGNLLIQWAGVGHSVMMTGPAITVFEGEISI